MADTLIICGGQSMPTKKAKNVIHMDVSPNADPAHRIDFDAAKMRARFVDELPDVVADALELAVYVFAADRLVKRGSSSSPEIGAGWQRRLQFQIPVRRPEIWQRRDVRDALIDVLTFLSGDELSFEFQQAVDVQSPEPFLGFGDPTAHVIRPDLVMLFSGGLDSLAGVATEVIGAGKSAVLVTHQSSNTIINRQNALAREITSRSGHKKVYYAPLRIRRGRDNPVEHSQRMRSFLFASVGLAYAQMFGRDSVHFFENGITSFNLPVADHVLGTRASRTTHPRVLAGFGRLFSLLLDKPVTICNPLLWETKTDIVARIASNGCADLIGMTSSCASVRNLSIKGAQCGVCSQCVERRLAIIAAGQQAFETEAEYEHEIFRGPLERANDRTMVLGHVRRARRFATASEQTLLSNYGQIFRALSSIGGPAQEVASRIVDLHRRYGQTLVDVVNEQLQTVASLDGLANVSSNSLLGMIAASTCRTKEFVDPVEVEPRPSTQATLDARARTPPRVVLAIDETKKVVAFDDGPVLKHKAYKLIARLADQRRADLAAGFDKTNYQFVRSAVLIQDLTTKTEQGLRQLVMRTRESLEAQFAAALGYTLSTNEIIESKKWGGYRLNPWVLLTDGNEIRRPAEKSRLEPQLVTSLERSVEFG